MKKYLKQPFDSIENINYLNALTLIKPAASNFKNLQKDIDKYINTLKNYCSATKAVGTKVSETAGNTAVRNQKLYLLQTYYKDYDYLITQLDIAMDKVDYKFTFKANCPD